MESCHFEPVRVIWLLIMLKKSLGVILAGGQSRRLFPFQRPKPLFEVGGRFLLEMAIERLKGFDIRIVASAAIAHEIRVAFRNRKLPIPDFWIEPEGRDTAAAVGFAVVQAKAIKAEWMAVISADHWMPDTRSFHRFLKRVGLEVHRFSDSLFVAGSPSQTKDPSTHSQFGWIVRQNETSKLTSFPVKTFVEKPKGAILQKLRKEGGLINAGMFFGRVSAFESAYRRFYPHVLDRGCVYSSLPRQPVDQAIFEKYESVRVFPFTQTWEDLGTWKDWSEINAQISDKQSKRACVYPPVDSIFTLTSSLKEVYVFGLDDLAVIEDGGRLLIMPLSQTTQMKNFLEAAFQNSSSSGKQKGRA